MQDLIRNYTEVSKMKEIIRIYNERKNCVVGMLVVFLVLSMLFTASVIKQDAEKISDLEKQVNQSYLKGWNNGADEGFHVGIDGGYEIGYQNASKKYVNDFEDGFDLALGKPLKINSLTNYTIISLVRETEIEKDLNLTRFSSGKVIFALAYYCENKENFIGKPLELRDQCHYPRYIRYDPDDTEDY